MNEDNPIEINRRDVLKGAAAVTLATAVTSISTQTSTAADENAKTELPATNARRDRHEER